MAKKVILTTEQHNMINNHIISEMVNPVNEDAWESVKHGLSKLGRYKAGGKIFGKDKTDQAAATQIQAIISKKGNEVIQKLDSEIKASNPEFPNNKNGMEFLKTIMNVASVYDTLVGATKKQPTDDGYLPVDAANGIITDLREYIKKYLDVDLKAVYSVMDEVEGGSLDLTETDLAELNEDESSDVRKHLQGKRGTGDDFSSQRMDTLKSNKLPIALSALGASLGAFNWLVNTDWFKHLFETITPDTATDAIASQSEVLNDIKPGEGVYKLLGRVTNNPLDGNSSPADFIDSLKQIGGGDAHKGIDMLCQDGGVMMKPQEAAAGLHELVNNPNQYQTMNDLFQGGQESSGTGKINPMNTTHYGTIAGRQLTSILIKMIPSIITKGAVKMGAGYAAAKGLGSVLGPIGIGLLAAGAVVKLMRMKGQKQSRAKTLNDLYQSLRGIDGGVLGGGTDIGQGIADPNISAPAGGDMGQGNSNSQNGKNVPRGTNDELYNLLKKLFQFIVNNKNMLGTRTADNVGTGAASMPATTNMAAGEKYLYNGKPVTIVAPDMGNGHTQVEYPNKTKMAVKSSKLQKMNENLFEGRYITDKRLVQFLEKSLSYDKLKSFENLITRVEQIRDKIKVLDTSKDPVLANFVKKFKTNPIIATDFQKLFTVSVDNPQAVNSLKAFIDDIFITLYSGQYKFSSLIDKMAGAGGGNINKVTEEAGYGMDQPNKSFIKDAQDRRTFKKNLLVFLTDAINVFQYLTKLRKNPPQPAAPQPAVTSEITEPLMEEISIPNSLITEEVLRIKKIMNTL